MDSKCCAACGQLFRLRPQVPHQLYCSAPACQRTRRQRWQQQKLKTDPDYRDNQARAQQSWRQRNPDYYRKYRKTHPDYAESNRTQQRERNARLQNDPIAKMDASIPAIPLPSGIYRLSLLTADGIAKMDVWTVEITAHACHCELQVKIAKRGRVR
jgi:hypothetical protein